MKIITKSLVVTGIIAVVGLVTAPAKAYFYQPQPYGQSAYYASQYTNPYNYGYRDNVSNLIQQHLNFVSNFVYVPTPYYGYGYNNYSPYSSYGYGSFGAGVGIYGGFGGYGYGY